MPAKLDAGFMKADSTNLPKVTCFMVWEYIVVNEKFNAPEISGLKTTTSSRECYGDSAVGYVCVQRTGPLCTVKGNICPEHRQKNKDYTVLLTVHEKTETVKDVACTGEECKASKGGCKHTIAFLMWVNRRFESPSPTDTECYWKRSKLSSIRTEKKFIRVDEMKKKNKAVSSSTLSDNSTFLGRVKRKAEVLQLDSQISRYLFELPERKVIRLSIHQLVFDYYGTTGELDFFKFATRQMDQELCQQVEKRTRNQNNDALWHEMRFGRTTASTIHEVTRCQKSGGSLVFKIVGAHKVYDTFFMKRGRTLEKSVIVKVTTDLKISVRSCGLILIPEFPFIGASPDAIGDDFILEVKCPGSQKTITNYIKNGVINEKFKAQMNLQMFSAKKKRGLFVVADPEFENNGKFQYKWIDFEENYTKALIKRAGKFWMEEIFPILSKTHAFQN